MISFCNRQRWARHGYLERVLAQSARCVKGLNDAHRARVLAVLLGETMRNFFTGREK